LDLAAQSDGVGVPVEEVLPVKQQVSTESVQNRVARHGTQTRLWLDLQASGRASSSQKQYATPVEQEAANQRLLDSYHHPIPEFFEQDASGKINE